MQRYPQRALDAMHANQWHNERQQRHQVQVIPRKYIYDIHKHATNIHLKAHWGAINILLLENANAITFNVAEINAGTFDLHLRMLAQHKPAHVCKKETA